MYEWNQFVYNFIQKLVNQTTNKQFEEQYEKGIMYKYIPKLRDDVYFMK